MATSGVGAVWARRRAEIVGLAALIVITPFYLAFADRAGRPLAVYSIPPLLTAVVGGWRATAFVAVVSTATATVIGIAGPLSALPLVARLAIIVVASGAATVGARYREQQQARLLELTEATALYHVFEAGLLPSPEPPPGYAVEIRFISSQEEMTLGGDFVDAVALDDGRLALVIGDVCGHGPREAAFATAVRAGWRTVAMTHRADPAAWLQHLDRTLFRADEHVGFVTACTMIVDRRRASVIVATAGHPPPVLLSRPARPVSVRAGRPLGLALAPGWTNTAVPLDGGLLLYTDGLVENRTDDTTRDRWSESELLDWLASVEVADPATLADVLLREVVERRTLDDDVAFVVVGVR